MWRPRVKARACSDQVKAGPAALASPACRSRRGAAPSHVAFYSAQQQHHHSTNGASQGYASSGDTRDVYVADLDLTRGNGAAAASATSRLAVPADTSVGDPRGGPASTSGSTAIQLSRDNEALKVELTGVREELARSAEQVQALTVQLADKERSLQAAKADMIETRLELQRNEERLQEVQERLQEATNERSEYRQYLLEAQAELQEARADLLEWSDGLSELNAVVEGLDGDLEGAFGDGAYRDAVAEAMRLTETLTGEGSKRSGGKSSGESESIAQALQGLQQLSAEVLRQAEEDRKLFGSG